jgi:hypothetical protein
MPPWTPEHEQREHEAWLESSDRYARIAAHADDARERAHRLRRETTVRRWRFAEQRETWRLLRRGRPT